MKRWQDVETDPLLLERVHAATALPRALCSVLVARGFSEPDDVDRYLHPRLSDLTDPFLLPAMAEAVQRVGTALATGERIVVFGDYDVDGLTSTALLVKVLETLGGNVRSFIPHRIEDGYGLSLEALDRCIGAQEPKLIVTVDCGTSSIEAVAHAQRAGVDVVITDHHEATSVATDAVAVVNPKLARREDLHVLAGVGVTFKLCHALLKRARDQGWRAARHLDLREHLDLVAMGTIADVVPLTGENRIFARRGLDRLGSEPCVGLRALMDAAGVEGVVETYHVGFILGPRLNAAGRLADAETALRLLTTDDPEAAAETAAQLERMNRDRREVEKKTADAAFKQIGDAFDPDRDFAIVVAGQGWHPGVVGIVASRICDRYYRPAVVIALDEDGGGRGSCRSIEGLNMADALASCAEHLVKSGGHAMAAGLDIRASSVEAFKSLFGSVVEDRLKGTELVPIQRVDAWLTLREANRELLASMESFHPFGHRNQTPVWATRAVHVVGHPQIVGQGHLKLRVASGGTEVECIGFGLGEHPLPEGPIDIAYQVKMNHFRGRDTLQLQLKDFRVAE